MARRTGGVNPNPALPAPSAGCSALLLRGCRFCRQFWFRRFRCGCRFFGRARGAGCRRCCGRLDRRWGRSFGDGGFYRLCRPRRGGLNLRFGGCSRRSRSFCRRGGFCLGFCCAGFWCRAPCNRFGRRGCRRPGFWCRAPGRGFSGRGCRRFGGCFGRRIGVCRDVQLRAGHRGHDLHLHRPKHLHQAQLFERCVHHRPGGQLGQFKLAADGKARPFKRRLRVVRGTGGKKHDLFRGCGDCGQKHPAGRQRSDCPFRAALRALLSKVRHQGAESLRATPDQGQNSKTPMQTQQNLPHCSNSARVCLKFQQPREVSPGGSAC